MAGCQPNPGDCHGFGGIFQSGKGPNSRLCGIRAGRTCRNDRDGPVSNTTHAKVVIVGSGPAGYTAA
ncbi:MAG: hypothetical protein WA661_14870, partial [Xanthobacteraceae bacterium]